MSLTAEQLELRRGKVMASDVAAYLGFHPWVKPFEAWARNLGLETFEEEENESMELGTLLERPLLELAARRIGMSDAAFGCPTMFRPDVPWAGATPDALGAHNGIQCKVSGLHMARDYQGLPGETGRFDNDAIPIYHLLQCQWEMFVTQRPLWHLAVYFGGRDFRIYALSYDSDLVGSMRAAAQVFWREHLDGNGPQRRPELDGSDAAMAFLRKTYPRNKGNLTEPTAEALALAQRYREADAKLKEWEAAKAEAKHKLCDLVGASDGIAEVCTWKKTNPKPRTDWESLAKALEGWDALLPDHTITPEGVRTFRLTLKE